LYAAAAESIGQSSFLLILNLQAATGGHFNIRLARHIICSASIPNSRRRWQASAARAFCSPLRTALVSAFCNPLEVFKNRQNTTFFFKIGSIIGNYLRFLISLVALD
jgi:hypothetical protein